MNHFLNELGVRVAALLAQARPETPQTFQAAEPGAVGADFRVSVWIAYGLALLLLTGFSLFLIFQNRGLSRRLVQLSERFEHAQAKSARQPEDA